MSKLARSAPWTRWTVAALAASAAVLISVSAASAPRDLAPSKAARATGGPDGYRRVAGVATSGTPEGAARTFASSYVSFLYGRGAAASVTPIAHGLHQELLGARSITTPAELTRAVLVRELTVSPRSGMTATASAVVDDEASPPYAFSFTLSFSHGRWRVTAVHRSAQ